MTFQNLTAEIQSLVQVQTDQQLKFLFFFLTIAIGGYYIFYHKKFVEKETAFFAVGLLRIVATIFSFFFILLSPLAIILLDPSVSFIGLYSPFLWMYLSLFVIVLFVLAMDFFYYIPLLMLKWAGVKMDHKYVRKVEVMLSKMKLR